MNTQRAQRTVFGAFLGVVLIGTLVLTLLFTRSPGRAISDPEFTAIWIQAQTLAYAEIYATQTALP